MHPIEEGGLLWSSDGDSLGVALSRWSLPAFSRYLRGQGIAVSPATSVASSPRPVSPSHPLLAGESRSRFRGEGRSPARSLRRWIQDNLSAHWTPKIRAFAEGNNVELVPTPTYASYLNRIENACFNPIAEFVVRNADYLDWDAFGLAIANHVRYRNDPALRAERAERAQRRRLAAAA